MNSQNESTPIGSATAPPPKPLPTPRDLSGFGRALELDSSSSSAASRRGNGSLNLTRQNAFDSMDEPMDVSTNEEGRPRAPSTEEIVEAISVNTTRLTKLCSDLKKIRDIEDLSKRVKNIEKNFSDSK